MCVCVSAYVCPSPCVYVCMSWTQAGRGGGGSKRRERIYIKGFFNLYDFGVCVCVCVCVFVKTEGGEDAWGGRQGEMMPGI